MSSQTRRIAILNRGEAAVRFLHAASEYSGPDGTRIETVALYVEGEESARFVLAADDRVCLGPAMTRDPATGETALAYLDHAVLMDALERAGADAVWPGWGFVAEDPAFVELCERRGITFIGPGSSCMRLLGDKIAAKRLAAAAGVPVTAWSGGPVATLDEAAAAADRIGYPVVIKATAGGGGRGIRMVQHPDELASQFASASAEAVQSFGDGRVFLESRVPAARHVEVQVAADEFGTVWALGVRDCTVQRRNQKVLEESRSSVLSPTTEQAIAEAAVALCREAGYRNVGTVEFLYTPATDEFFFMEVNTRLQVEHTVTEVVTGIDLVKLQLQIADGHRLPVAPPPSVGHAVQVRLNAEDPHTFAPTPGTLRVLQLPDGPGVRVDAGYREGDTIPVEYDSMIAKIVAWGRDRSEALARMRRALADTVALVEQGATNRSLLARIVDHPKLHSGDYDNAWLDREPLIDDGTGVALALAVTAVETHLARRRDDERRFRSTVRRGRPELQPETRPISLRNRGCAYEFDVRSVAPGVFHLSVGDTSFQLEWEPLGRCRVRVSTQGAEHLVLSMDQGATQYVEAAGAVHRVERGEAGLVRAVSPGVVVALRVATGDRVEVGDTLAVVEAMKLEAAVVSPVAGVVTEVLAALNVQVDAGEGLMRISSANTPQAAPAEERAQFGRAPGGAGSLPSVDPMAQLMGFDRPLADCATQAPDPENLLRQFARLCALTLPDEGRDRAVGEVRHDGERRFFTYLRSPGRATELLPESYQDQLRDLLDWYGLSRSNPEDAGPPELMLLFRAWQNLPEYAPRVVQILRRVVEDVPLPDWAERVDLDLLVGTTDLQFPVVAEWARAARSRVLEQRGRLPRRHPDPHLPDVSPKQAQVFELWRLSRFVTRRAAAEPDVLLLHGTSPENPADERLFAFVAVDLVNDEADVGTVTRHPQLEKRILAAFAAIRRERLRLPWRERTVGNRVTVYVEPDWAVSDRDLKALAHALAAEARGLDLEKIVIRAHVVDHPGLPAVDTVIQMPTPRAVGVSVGRGMPSAEPVRPRTAHRQRSMELRRRGETSPYEIIDLLTAPTATDADFPLGSFVEHDLVGDTDLRPVDRAYGLNTANVVVGVIESRTAKHPKGMRRVIILGDPARSLGALAEPECRRILAALDLAETLEVPVEWFTISSGARVAMDSGTENLDWTAAVLRRIVEFTQAGREINIVVSGVNVGAQAYFDAEATMLMHTRGALVMVPSAAMVLTGKQALDVSGSVSAEDNFGIGGFERVMGPNGQAQYWARDLESACDLLFRYYDHTYVAQGDRFPRRRSTLDPVDRDVSGAPHPDTPIAEFRQVGDVFSDATNPDRKKPFDIRAVMTALHDADAQPLERWAAWEGAETAVVWDVHIGGVPTSLLGIESKNVRRQGSLPADGPRDWTAGTLFPQSSKKLARAINAASGNRPVVVLANLSGFDGSPESMRQLQLEYGAELGRAVVNFRGPIVFCVVSRYHGGAFVVFSKRLNEQLHVAALEGAKASVLGGAPAASVVFTREVSRRVALDPRVVALEDELATLSASAERTARSAMLEEVAEQVRAEVLAEVAAEFDGVHTVERARAIGSIDSLLPVTRLRPHVIAQLEKGIGVR